MRTKTSYTLMQSKYHTLFTLLGTLVLFLLTPMLLPNHLSVHAAVVINEIFPKTDNPADQWIELYNNGSESVSLNRWKLQNSSGASFIINASGIIGANAFLTFDESQTAISLSKDGDSVQLLNDNNTQMDSQSYPGTLGYNTSMGRSVDGAGVWTLCTAWTKNTSNNCPPPPNTPTPTPAPIPLPTSTPVPTDTPMDSPTPTAIMTFAPITFGNVLGTTRSLTPTLTPTPTPGDVVKIVIPNTIEIPKSLAIQIGIVIGAWILIAVTAALRSKQKRQKRPTPPVN